MSRRIIRFLIWAMFAAVAFFLLNSVATILWVMVK